MSVAPAQRIRVVGTAGHVDHGKSTLVHALTGIDPDRFEEEKRRGLTIDLGFAWCTLPSGTEIGIVDVPGHRRFIRNMLAGVGALDAALFVVAADEGWRPQSEEHLQILDFLGVSAGVVALTKADLAADRTERVAHEVASRLSGSVLENAAIVPVSARTAAGIDALRDALDTAVATGARPPAAGRARLFADRSFTIAGAGTVVTGTLTGGRLRVGDEVTVLPSALRARVRGLQTHRRRVDEASAGSRVALNLAGVDVGVVGRGHVIVTGRWRETSAFAASLRAPRELSHPVEERGAFEVHVGTAQSTVRLKLLDGALEAAGSRIAVLYCDRPLPVVPGDRFVVRDLGRWQTVAGGEVLDNDPGALTRGDDRALERLRARAGRSGPDLAELVLAERGALRDGELELLSGTPGHPPAAIRTTRHLLDGRHAAELRARAMQALEAHRNDAPLAPGPTPAELATRLGVAADLADELVELWVREGHVERAGPHVRLPGASAMLPPEERRRADDALERLRAGGASPPGLKDAGLGLPLAKALERAGELVLVAPDIGYPAEVWRDISARVSTLLREEGSATVSRIREALGTSRKYAVPLLERLDATGVTRRTGDVRTLGPAAG